MSSRPWRSSVSSIMRPTSSSFATSALMPPSGGLRSAIATVAPSAARPSAIAAPIPCAPPVTSATRPSSLTRSPDRRERGGNQDPVLLRMQQRLEPGEEVLPSLVGLKLRTTALTFRVVLVAPEAGVRRERPDVRRERADEPAQMLLLDRDPLRLVHAEHLWELPGVDVVVALLDDHRREPTWAARLDTRTEGLDMSSGARDRSLGKISQVPTGRRSTCPARSSISSCRPTTRGPPRSSGAPCSAGSSRPTLAR